MEGIIIKNQSNDYTVEHQMDYMFANQEENSEMIK